VVSARISNRPGKSSARANTQTSLVAALLHAARGESADAGRAGRDLSTPHTQQPGTRARPRRRSRVREGGRGGMPIFAPSARTHDREHVARTHTDGSTLRLMRSESSRFLAQSGMRSCSDVASSTRAATREAMSSGRREGKMRVLLIFKSLPLGSSPAPAHAAPTQRRCVAFSVRLVRRTLHLPHPRVKSCVGGGQKANLPGSVLRFRSAPRRPAPQAGSGAPDALM
jgi:hypothetical protein